MPTDTPAISSIEPVGPVTASPSLSSIFNTDALFNNPLFAGGIGIASLGFAAAVARNGVTRAASLIKRRMLVNIEVSKVDPSYQSILAWLALPREQTGFLASRLTRIHDRSLNTRGNKQVLLQPGYGRMIVKHENAYILVDRSRQSSSSRETGEPFETLLFTTLYAHRHVFESVFREAIALGEEAMQGKTVIWTVPGRGFVWEPFGPPRRKRPISSVILEEGMSEKILGDVKEFMARQQWYDDRGIPYRRGYLLYGPPGSGKTSFIYALAGELDHGVSIINMSESGMTDDKLASMLLKLPPKTFVLLEDADAAFRNRRQVDGEGYSGATVTFSGLLNALDGVAAGDNRIVFLTTNHIERLDPALIRPGRVDMTVRIGEATRYQASGMWDRFYGDVDTNGMKREEFLDRLTTLGLIADKDGMKTSDASMRTSTAALQSLFIYNKEDMDGAIALADGLIPRAYEPEPETQNGGL